VVFAKPPEKGHPVGGGKKMSRRGTKTRLKHYRERKFRDGGRGWKQRALIAPKKKGGHQNVEKIQWGGKGHGVHQTE